MYYKQTFYYMPVREGGDAHSKEDQNKQWCTLQGTNFEFLQVASMQLQLAEDPVYDPWITVRVWEQGGNFWNDTLVGEVRMPMGHFLPWLQSEDQFKASEARDEYREPTYHERMQAIAENRNCAVCKRGVGDATAVGLDSGHKWDARRELAHEGQHGARVRSAIDEIAQEHELRRRVRPRPGCWRSRQVADEPGARHPVPRALPPVVAHAF